MAADAAKGATRGQARRAARASVVVRKWAVASLNRGAGGAHKYVKGADSGPWQDPLSSGTVGQMQVFEPDVVAAPKSARYTELWQRDADDVKDIVAALCAFRGQALAEADGEHDPLTNHAVARSVRALRNNRGRP